MDSDNSVMMIFVLVALAGIVFYAIRPFILKILNKFDFRKTAIIASIFVLILIFVLSIGMFKETASFEETFGGMLAIFCCIIAFTGIAIFFYGIISCVHTTYENKGFGGTILFFIVIVAILLIEDGGQSLKLINIETLYLNFLSVITEHPVFCVLSLMFIFWLAFGRKKSK